MGLWLDGGFWGRWINKVFVSEIQWMRRAIFEHILPSFPDPSTEGHKARDEAWEIAMSQVSDGTDDPTDYVEWAEEQGFETYLGITKMRQAAANLSVVMLRHLVEQQMLFFHMRQVLSKSEEQEVREQPKTRQKLLQLEDFHRRLNEGGCSMKTLPSWQKVEELRHVANAVKHGPGISLDKLCETRPDLLTLPGAEILETSFQRNPAWVERPASGDDIYVRDDDLVVYFDAAVHLW